MDYGAKRGIVPCVGKVHLSGKPGKGGKRCATGFLLPIIIIIIIVIVVPTPKEELWPGLVFQPPLPDKRAESVYVLQYLSYVCMYVFVTNGSDDRILPRIW